MCVHTVLYNRPVTTRSHTPLLYHTLSELRSLAADFGMMQQKVLGNMRCSNGYLKQLKKKHIL